jgi:hypothetical protein
MTTHTFKLILAGADVLTPEISDALFEAGINGDDTLVGSRGGAVFVDFEREAESLGDAVGSAIKQVEKAGHKVAKVEVEEPTAAR